ncbi:uncharacterized protein [Aegilops tauschii subsp. strangulata]|uniref:uncharacterized protein n=1 Tax=Aegilops tauschii subsp. strangulata TaxID=200361 RepID=UPI003CC87EF4
MGGATTILFAFTVGELITTDAAGERFTTDAAGEPFTEDAAGEPFTAGATGEPHGVAKDPRREPEEASAGQVAESEFEPEVYVQASSRQNTPAPSPTACQEQPFFKVSSRFESEMKEANEMLMESKKLRVKTSKQKTVTFAPILEYRPEIENKVYSNKECPESTTEIFRKACATVFQAALKMVSRIQDTMVAYNIDKRHMVEILVSVNRYLLLKLEPSPDDEALAEVITEAALNLLDAWTENVERPLMQRAKKISSWFLQEGRVEFPPVSLSTRPCAAEDAEEFY